MTFKYEENVKVTNIRISIIVPVYKVEKELDRCVKSLIKQTYKQIEIILVDDGSPDRCPQMCDKYSKSDQRIKVIHKENGGLSDARNTGLLAATGKYVLYVDSDDYIELDACERFIKCVEDDVDVVVGSYREVNNGKCTVFCHSGIVANEIYSSKEYVINSIKHNEWYAPAWLNLYNRSFLIKNDLFYKKGLLFEDHEMLPRLFLAAKRVKYMDYPFYIYVIRNNSIMTSRVTDKQRQMSIEIYTSWLECFKTIEDNEYQRYLYGALVKYYLANCRSKKITRWEITNLNFRFAFKYALNTRERVKVVLFNFLPKLYNSISA